jgi:hypothetical protein
MFAVWVNKKHSAECWEVTGCYLQESRSLFILGCIDFRAGLGSILMVRKKENRPRAGLISWNGGGIQIRTGEWRFCRPLPYHLAMPPKKMERETGFEPATSTLARSHSTTELFPLSLKMTFYPLTNSLSTKNLVLE